MLDSVSAVFKYAYNLLLHTTISLTMFAFLLSAITGMRAENTSIPRLADLKNNPWVPPADGRCIVNELPTELLAYIFELGYQIEKEGPSSAADDDDSDDGRSLGTLSHSSSGSTTDERHLPAELLVSRVCQRWRSVALALPVLWTTLEFKDPFLDFEQQKVYLERAKGAPLDISIDCTFDEEDDREEHGLLQTEDARYDSRVYGEVKQVMDIIAPHALQWRSLEVMVSHYMLMQLVLESLGSLSDGAPLLEVLQLYHYEDDSEDPETFRHDWLRKQEFVLFHNKVPKLSHVTLWGVHLDWPKTTFLRGLHELELAYHAQDVRPSYRDFLRMLKTSPDLVTLALYDSGPAGGPVEWLSSVTADPLDIDEDYDMSTSSSSPSGPQISDPSPTMHTLSSLRNLILSFHPATYAIDLLDRLPMPSLHSLALDFDDDRSLLCTTLLTRLYSPHPSSPPGSSRSILGTIEALKLGGLRTYYPSVVVRAALTLTNLTQLNINADHVDWTWIDLLIDPLRAATEASVVASDSGETTVTASTVVCPRLAILTATGVDGDTLRKLVEARRQAGHPIEELYVDEEEPLNTEEVRWFRENLEVFEFFQASDDEFEDDEDDEDDADIFVELEEAEWEDEVDVEEEADGDEDEWTDED
jgi:hypothetical protein